MNRKFTLCKNTSAALCSRLEHELARVFANRTIGKYLTIDGNGTELQILDSCVDAEILPHFKLAYSVWNEMETLDRHRVLGCFQQLYATLPQADRGNRKTLIFCAVFIHELAVILAEAMEWPD